MKFSTANGKNPNYNENHEIYVGTHTGSFKKINVSHENPYRQINLQNLKTLTKESKITSLEYGNDEVGEILIGRVGKVVQVFDKKASNFDTNVEFPDGPIVGLARYDDKLIGGLASGNIYVLQYPDPITITTGDNMSHLRQCKFDKKLVATGGKERQNNLKVFDLDSGKQIFSSKNLPNDFLQLEVPVWDTDLGFIDANTIATCSRYGYVRLYDTRKQRRPIQKYSNEDQMSFSCLIARDNMIYVGTTMGALKAFDTRNFKNFVHTYKGFTGSLSSLYLDESGKYLASSSLDRYVRIHHTDSCVLMYQCYVKSKATCVLLETVESASKATNDDCELVTKGEEEKNGSDDEYNAMFDNMETVSEKDQGDTKKNKRKPDSSNYKKLKRKKL